MAAVVFRTAASSAFVARQVCEVPILQRSAMCCASSRKVSAGRSWSVHRIDLGPLLLMRACMFQLSVDKSMSWPIILWSQFAQNGVCIPAVLARRSCCLWRCSRTFAPSPCQTDFRANSINWSAVHLLLSVPSSSFRFPSASRRKSLLPRPLPASPSRLSVSARASLA